MKLNFTIGIVFLAMLMACKADGIRQKRQVNNTDLNLDTTAAITIQDSSDYSTYFLNSLSDKSGIQLVDSLLIFDGVDTLCFPTLLPPNEKFTFTKNKGDYTYQLNLWSKNYTSFEFELTLKENHEVFYYKKGIAELKPSFYLGAEIYAHPQVFDSYMANDYYVVNDSCKLSFAIGEYNEQLIVNTFLPCIPHEKTGNSSLLVFLNN